MNLIGLNFKQKMKINENITVVIKMRLLDHLHLQTEILSLHEKEKTLI